MAKLESARSGQVTMFDELVSIIRSVESRGRPGWRIDLVLD
jgi:hypothetical protein